MTAPAASAYSATADAWQRGPARIYDRMSEVVVECCPVPVAGARALDLGAGTGAASRALLRASAARVVAVDAAHGMLALDAGRRPPAVVGDALALPFTPRAFDATVAAFSLNHLENPGAGLAEAARVTRRGGAVLAAAYADDDFHPVKDAVETALAAQGWRPEPWYQEVRAITAPKLATVEAARAAAAEADLDLDVVALRVPFPGLVADDLVWWRLGLAQHARFLASLTPIERDAVVADALDRLGSGWPELDRSIILVRGVVR